jgi:hypothetical protein
MAHKRRKKQHRRRMPPRHPQPDLPENPAVDEDWAQFVEELTGVPFESALRAGGTEPQTSGQAYHMTQLSMLALLGFSDEAANDFMAWHDEVPEDIERWSQAQLAAAVSEARTSRSHEAWKRALTLLAHHRSRFAAEQLRDLLDLLPPELGTFWDLAFAEAVAWLNYKVYEAEGQLELVNASVEAEQMN